MVGVPRSGGCHTCRRRRVGCDQEKPRCARCLTNGRICEGYERYNTFVNRTADGVVRRARLEEAIPGGQATVFTTPPIYSAIPLSNANAEVVPGIISDDIEVAHFNEFLNSYQPKSPSNRDGSTLIWMTDLCSRESNTDVLRYAICALSTSNATASPIPATTVTGPQYYGEALRHLHLQLSQVPVACSDELLAAIRCLMIYELFESTTGSVTAWNNHQNGLVRLVAQRGPTTFSSPAAKALLADIRNVNVISAIQNAKSSLLGAREWQLQGDIESLSNVEQKYSDLVLDVAALYEREEQILTSEQSTLEQLEDLLTRMDRIVIDLEGLLQILPRFEPLSISDHDLPFWDLESAIIYANIQVMILEGSIAVRELCDRLNSIELRSEQQKALIANVLNRYSTDGDTTLAANVLTAVEYAIGADMGLYGAVRSLFPVRMMLCNLPSNSLQFEQFDTIYNKLHNLGLQHTKDLDQFWGQPGHLTRTKRSTTTLPSLP